MIIINRDAILSGNVAIEFEGRNYTVAYEDFNRAIRSLVKPGGDDKTVKTQLHRASFAKFWDVHGKKNKKESAWKVWLKLKDDEIKSIFDTLPNWLRVNSDLKYRPFPDTYLRGKRWEDELPGVFVQKKPQPSFVEPATFGR